jgi:hypothetical protein
MVRRMIRDIRSGSSAEARQTPGAYFEGSAGRLQGEAHAIRRRTRLASTRSSSARTRQKFDAHSVFLGTHIQLQRLRSRSDHLRLVQIFRASRTARLNCYPRCDCREEHMASSGSAVNPPYWRLLCYGRKSLALQCNFGNIVTIML